MKKFAHILYAVLLDAPLLARAAFMARQMQSGTRHAPDPIGALRHIPRITSGAPPLVALRVIPIFTSLRHKGQ